ncbi:cytochrome c heme-binding site [Pyrrhoderma noxium]|uniref:Cytochrome c heme-binding site n=1 Tax=Pyrrhoderma noxium TaxID=2282107 RepID=A0A286UVE1_9AGAM|nr:cytochrome c heme-binding site [Pyrrhoderma noxium]
MDLFFCLPVIFGCQTKIKPEGDPNDVRICPRCNNASVIQAKSREWFELCWVPLIPMNSKHIWICGICQWQVPIQQGWEPMRPGAGFAPGWQHQAQQGWHGGPAPQVSGYGQPYNNFQQK